MPLRSRRSARHPLLLAALLVAACGGGGATDTKVPGAITVTPTAATLGAVG